MLDSHLGEFAALCTAFFWTITALAFEYAGKKIGSLSVNLIRLLIAFILLGCFSLIYRGMFFPIDATSHQWLWLSVSGMIGFVLGDLLLFQAYVVIGARISMLIMALSPPVAAILGWLLLNEKLSFQNIIGMTLTLGGIILVILKNDKKSESNIESKKKIKLSYPIAGLLLAFGGMIGQASGLVISKYGMQDYDAFSATQIRVLTGVISFSILFFILRRWNRVFDAIKNKSAMTGISIGAFFGPFLGVSFSLLAIKYTSTGIASTIMSIIPVLIIAPSVILFKEKLTHKEVIGSFIAVGGVALFFL